MINLCVRTGATTGYSAAGETMVFDFSADVPAGSQILAYAAGLTGFMLNYATDSTEWAENLGQMQISLVPAMMNQSVIVQANGVLSDYDDDVAGVEAPATSIQAAVLALVGPSQQLGSNVLGNVFGVANGPLPTIAIRSNPQNFILLSGFNLMAQGGADEISSLNLQATQAVGGGSLSGSVAVSVGDLATNATADVLMMSLAGNLGQVVPVSAAWNSLDSKATGITGTLTAIFTVPSGQTLLGSRVALLLQTLKVMFENSSHELELVGGQTTAPPTVAITGSTATVTWPYALNIYNPDAFVFNSYISSNIYFTAYAVAQFTSG